MHLTRRSSSPLILALLALAACDSNPYLEELKPSDAPPPSAPAAAAPATAAPTGSAPAGAAERPVDPVDPTILLRPFTAEEIRDEWVEGLTLVMATRSAEGMALERWRVVAADDEGAEIEVGPIDAEGNATADPRVGRSTWLELRDHASFPADVSTRAEVVRETPLGELDGWLYRVPDEAAGTVTEYFFARSLPGAPVELRILRDGEPILELAQMERSRPDDPT